MSRNTHTPRGFTLIELLVTMVIGVVLMMVAVPSFTTYKRNAELTSATNTLLAAINAARGEAMKRGMNAMVVPTDNGSDWSTGWVVFVDKSRNQVYDNANTDTTVLTQSALPSYITVTGTGNASGTGAYIMFDASGYAKSKSASGGGAMGSTAGNLSLTLTRNDTTGSDVSDQTRIILIANTGRARSCKPKGSTDTSCQAGYSQNQ